MAKAELLNPFEVNDGTAFVVETWPDRAPPFTGTAARDWDDFVVEDDASATFEWRTPADSIRAAATKVRDGVWSLERAKQESYVTEWLTSQADAFVWLYQEEFTGLGEMDDAEFEKLMLVEAGAELDNSPDGVGYYLEADDAPASDAAWSLAPLPGWARIDSTDEGGPGTGFEQTVIVLEDGFGLKDLADYLNGTEVERGTR